MVHVVIVIVTLAGLALGGDLFVRGAAGIGRRLGMTPMLIGATIVAVGTSLPEWAVSVNAARNGLVEISAGNVVGSNVFNVLIILGLTALVCPIRIGISWLPRDGMVMLCATLALLVVCVDGEIGRLEGVLLLVMAVVTLTAMVISGRVEKREDVTFHWRSVPFALIGLPMILVSSHFFIGSAAELARQMNVSEWAIGITAAAVGTSLPELVTALAAAWQKRPEIVVGNLLGSNTMNIFFVLGSAASILPLSSGHLTLLSSAVFGLLMLFSVVLLAGFRGLPRPAGLVLLLAGLGWYVLEVLR